MINVEFDDVPKEVIPIIKSLHDKYINWFPCWMQTVTYQFKSQKEDNEGTVAENYTSYPYRRVHINIFANFLQIDEKYREEVFVHELCHSFSGLIAIPVFDIIAKLIDDDKFRAIMTEELTEKFEGFTQDLAYSVLQYMRQVDKLKENLKQGIKNENKKSQDEGKNSV